MRVVRKNTDNTIRGALLESGDLIILEDVNGIAIVTDTFLYNKRLCVSLSSGKVYSICPEI